MSTAQVRAQINEYMASAGATAAPFSNMEIDELLEIVGREKNHYLENLSRRKINKELKDVVVKKYGRPDLYEVLKDDYRVIDELHELTLGRYVRWMREDGYLTPGGVLTGIWTGTLGAAVSCKSVSFDTYITFTFHTNTTFQKLTNDEKIILSLKDYLTASDGGGGTIAVEIPEEVSAVGYI